MANFDRSGMTQAGINLMGKAIGGATIQFTKLVLGDGEMTGEILDLQGVVSAKQNVDVTRIERNDNQCTVGGELLTSSVKQGFFWRECGLYAMDPDAGEILYNYAYSTKPDYIADSNSGMMEEILVSMIATVGSNTNVDVTIDDSIVMTTKKEFLPIKNKVKKLISIDDFILGNDVDDCTSAIQKAALSGKKVYFPSGEYTLSGTVQFAPNTEFYGDKATTKITFCSNDAKFMVGHTTTIDGFTINIDYSGYNNSIFEISSESQEAYYVDSCVRANIKNINIRYVNGEKTGTVFYIWARKNKTDGTLYKCPEIWDINISNIYCWGDIKYFCRNWCNKGNDGSWITTVSFKNCFPVYSQYGWFGAESEETLVQDINGGMRDAGVVNFIDCKHQSSQDSKHMFVFTQGDKNLVGCIGWDWNQTESGKPIAFVYNTKFNFRSVTIDREYGMPEERIKIINNTTNHEDKYLIYGYLASYSGHKSMLDEYTPVARRISLNMSYSDSFPVWFEVGRFTLSSKKRMSLKYDLIMDYNMQQGTSDTTITIMIDQDGDITSTSTIPLAYAKSDPYVKSSRLGTIHITKKVNGQSAEYIVYHKFTESPGPNAYVIVYPDRDTNIDYYCKTVFKKVASPTGYDTMKEVDYSRNGVTVPVVSYLPNTETPSLVIENNQLKVNINGTWKTISIV